MNASLTVVAFQYGFCHAKEEEAQSQIGTTTVLSSFEGFIYISLEGGSLAEGEETQCQQKCYKTQGLCFFSTILNNFYFTIIYLTDFTNLFLYPIVLFQVINIIQFAKAKLVKFILHDLAHILCKFCDELMFT